MLTEILFRCNSKHGRTKPLPLAFHLNGRRSARGNDGEEHVEGDVTYTYS
jgi:hypothetical protein